VSAIQLGGGRAAILRTSTSARAAENTTGDALEPSGFEALVCALLIHVSARTKLRMLTDTESLARSDCDGSVQPD